MRGNPVWAAALLAAALVALLPAVADGGRTVAARTSLAVYLVRGEHVAPVRRTVPHTTAVARAALVALLRGATAAERKAGYGTCIPAGTLLRGVSIAHGVATVDLTGRFESGGGSLSMLLRVAQVVHTATQFPSVGRVAFLLDGRPVEWIGGEGIVVAPPVSRATFEGQAPAILVEQPLPGDRVRAPIVVRGTANVFEAALEVDVVTPGGKLLAHRALLATAGTGTRGSFGARIAVPASASRVVVVVYSRSGKDGSRINVVRVPVTVAR